MVLVLLCNHLKSVWIWLKILIDFIHSAAIQSQAHSIVGLTVKLVAFLTFQGVRAHSKGRTFVVSSVHLSHTWTCVLCFTEKYLWFQMKSILIFYLYIHLHGIFLGFWFLYYPWLVVIFTDSNYTNNFDLQMNNN